jgi:hypothetical protein
MRLINLAGSTLLAAIGYDRPKQVLVAQFHKNGKFFLYEGVQPLTFIDVITNRASVGSAFTAFIKGGPFPFREVTAEEVEKL